MNIQIFYGPRKEFLKDIPEAHITFDQVVRISDQISRFPVKSEDIPNLGNVVANSMSYSGITEGAEQNFVSIFRQFDDRILSLYLQNPTEGIRNEIIRVYGAENIETEYYEYPSLKKHHIIKFHDKFSNTIIGQERVKEELISVLYSLYKKKNEGKPIVLMFYGESGVGKTETAKYLSSLVGGKLLRKQFSMFQSNDFADYLFGGKHYGQCFAKDLLERESNIILLDEYDKANPIFYSAFYQIFDEGIFEDKNYKVGLKNTIFICTSNYLKPEEIRKALGDPIFYRFDKLIKFNPLTKEDKELIVKQIVEKEFYKLTKQEKELISLENMMKIYLPFASDFRNYRNAESLIKDDINKFLANEFIKNSYSKRKS